MHFYLGLLFRFDQGKTREVMRTDITIPNSVCWSPDGKTMYFTHSSARQIFAWDYDEAHGTLSNERLFYEHKGPGEPDGCKIDKDGNLWHAVYGESRVIKISPKGEIVGHVNLPTSHVTCPEFVGTELFITCAEDDNGEGDSKKYGGAVFRVDVGTTGLEPRSFKLQA
jgi:sugar lactone lactonase YvrE